MDSALPKARPVLRPLRRQRSLFGEPQRGICVSDPIARLQLLKWVGNKQRFVPQILPYFPAKCRTYYEPFLGSGAVLGSLGPARAVGSDICAPLIGIWQLVKNHPSHLAASYAESWEQFMSDPRRTYLRIRDRYNNEQRPEDLFFLSRSCYAGVIRFRRDGHMSTPIGPHRPISPDSAAVRVRLWHGQVRGTDFLHSDFEAIIGRAGEGDLVYCDPPYVDSQKILYGAQDFSTPRLYASIGRAKERGALIALSMPGTKKSGRRRINIGVPSGLFERSIPIATGRSMLRRLQMSGRSLESEQTADRLLLTWRK